MPNKKKFFKKDNSVKFLLLHGNTEAVNADGKHLENTLVPVSKNYKAGSSLLLSNIAALCNSEPSEDAAEEPNLKKIMDAFDDSDSEVVIEDLPLKMKKLNFSEKSKTESFDGNEEEEDDFFDNFEVDGQFSDASDGSFEDDVDDDRNDNTIDPNCPEALKMFNAKFEKVLEEYDEDQIGALDDEDISGYLSTSSKRVTDLLNAAEYNEEEPIVLGKCDEEMKQKILNYAEDSGDENMVKIVTEKPIEFDCESIISTYSNKYNHPTVIKEGKIKKRQIPDSPGKKNLTESLLKTLCNGKESDSESDDNVSVSTVLSVRVKGETPEQRRERKRLCKEARRKRRIIKKETKLLFSQNNCSHYSHARNAECNNAIKLL